MILEDEADVLVAEVSQMGLIECERILLEHRELAARGPVERAEDVEQRTFP